MFPNTQSSLVKDPALYKSYLIAAVLVTAIAVWLASGYLGRGTAVQQMPASGEKTVEPVKVQVRQQQAEPVVREIAIQGQVEPKRVVTLRAETSGQITALLAEKGQRVDTGDVLLRLKMDDRAARLRQAQAMLHRRERDYEALQRLGRTGYQAETQINEAYALLETARADLQRIEVEIEKTAIRAPFAAILNDRLVEFGEFVSINDPVATLVDDDPLVVAGQAPQQNIDKLRIGRVATVKFVTGKEARGQLRYISATADTATRTFRVELEIQNPSGEYTAGVSAEIRIPIETIPAQFVSPALLTLDDRGVLGVKTVDENALVQFHPVRIVRAAVNGVWVSGLPELARIITVGQGFVRPGDAVVAMPETEVQTPGRSALVSGLAEPAGGNR